MLVNGNRQDPLPARTAGRSKVEIIHHQLLVHTLLVLALALAWVGILAGIWLGWQLLRQNGRILLRLDELEKRLDDVEFGEEDRSPGLPVGLAAPAFELPDLTGQHHRLEQFRGQPLLLIFFHPACGFCRDLLPLIKAEMGRSESGRGGRQDTEPESRSPRVIFVSAGGVEANRALFAEHGFEATVVLQKESEIATAYQAHGTPSGYRIDSEGRIASELAMGSDALLRLAYEKAVNSAIRHGTHPRAGTVTNKANGDGHEGGNGRADRFRNRSLANSRLKRDGLKAGTPAPEFRLPRLDGAGDLALSDLQGRRVLLVFSSPTCGPCVSLAPRLEKFHREHPELAVVMISKGEPKENRLKVKEHGLSFPIVLQQQWEISRRYAMFATPVAYLIDEASVIVRDPVVGADGILNLLATEAVQHDLPKEMEPAATL